MAYKDDGKRVPPPLPKLGRKDDQGKLDWTLLPFEGLAQVVRVLEFGVLKYGRDNWQLVPNAQARYIRAAFRHLISDIQSADVDTETGEGHLAHAVCCLLFVLHLRHLQRFGIPESENGPIVGE